MEASLSFYVYETRFTGFENNENQHFQNPAVYYIFIIFLVFVIEHSFIRHFEANE